MNLYMVMVYYRRPPGFVKEYRLPSSELWCVADSESEAMARAESLSRENPEDEFAIEGGQHEPGGWTNPIYRAGRRIQ